MATNNFDPTQYGATKFDPTQFGATPIQKQSMFPMQTPESQGAVKQQDGTYKPPSFLEGLKQSAIGAGNFLGKQAIGWGQTLLKAGQQQSTPLTKAMNINTDKNNAMSNAAIQTGEDLKTQMQPQNQAQQGGAIAANVGEALLPLAKPVAGTIENAPKILAESFTKGIGSVAEDVGNVVNKGKSVLSSGKDLEQAQGVLENLKTQKADVPMQRFSLTTEKSDIMNSIRDVKSSASSTIGDMTNTFKETNQTLQQTLQDEAKTQSSINKGTLKTLFKSISATYSKGLSNAEDVLMKTGVDIKPADYLSKVVDTTLDNARNYGIPDDNPAIQVIKKLQDDVNKRQIFDPNHINLSDLIKMKNQVYDTLNSGVKLGRTFSSSDDLVANMFLKNHGSFIGEMSPELAQLNKEFKPMADARNWAMKNFKPFNPQEIQKGANVLTQIASGKVPNQTTLNYLETLSKGSGQFEGAGNLTGETTKIGQGMKDLKSGFDLAKQNIISSTDYQVQSLTSKLDDINGQLSDLKKQGIDTADAIRNQTKIVNQIKTLNNIKKAIIAVTIGTAITATGIPKKILPFIGL